MSPDFCTSQVFIQFLGRTQIATGHFLGAFFSFLALHCPPLSPTILRASSSNLAQENLGSRNQQGENPLIFQGADSQHFLLSTLFNRLYLQWLAIG